MYVLIYMQYKWYQSPVDISCHLAKVGLLRLE